MSVTKDDMAMVAYFFQEMGDIERWNSWEDRKADIFHLYPDLEIALKQAEFAKKTLQLIVEAIIKDFEAATGEAV